MQKIIIAQSIGTDSPATGLLHSVMNKEEPSTGSSKQLSLSCALMPRSIQRSKCVSNAMQGNCMQKTALHCSRKKMIRCTWSSTSRKFAPLQHAACIAQRPGCECKHQCHLSHKHPGTLWLASAHRAGKASVTLERRAAAQAKNSFRYGRRITVQITCDTCKRMSILYSCEPVGSRTLLALADRR